MSYFSDKAELLKYRTPVRDNYTALNKGETAGTHVKTNDTGGNWDLSKPGDVEKFMQDISDGALDGNVDYSNRDAVLLSKGRAILKGGVEYDLTTTAGLAAFLKDAKDGKIDGKFTPAARANLGAAVGMRPGYVIPQVPLRPAAPKDEAETVPDVGGDGHVCATDVAGADEVSYPKPGDLDGWKSYLKENGYQAFMNAFYDNKVDKSIIGDSEFQLLLHSALRKETGASDGADGEHWGDHHDHGGDSGYYDNRGQSDGRGQYDDRGAGRGRRGRRGIGGIGGGGGGRFGGIGRGGGGGGSFNSIRSGTAGGGGLFNSIRSGPVGGGQGANGGYGPDGAHGPGGAQGARGHQGNDYSGRYPAVNDTQGWKHFLQESGYDAFMGAFEDGKISRDVLSDKELALALQREQQADTRFWQTMSQMSQNRHQIRANIIRNMRA